MQTPPAIGKIAKPKTAGNAIASLVLGFRRVGQLEEAVTALR